MIIDILGIENVSKGNSFSELVASIASAVLPLIASFLLNILTIEEIFWILPFFTFLGALAFYILYFLLPDQKKNKKGFNKFSLNDAIIYAFKDKNIAPILTLAICMIVGALLQPLIPSYSRDNLGLDGSSYTLLQSVNFLGAIMGSIILLKFGNRIISGKFMSLWMILFSGFIFIFFSINNPIVAGISLLLANLFNAIWITSIWTSLQTFSDEKFVGRVVSIVTISFGISGFFYMLGGFLGDFIGVYPTMLIACLLIIAINLLVLSYSENFRKLKI